MDNREQLRKMYNDVIALLNEQKVEEAKEVLSDRFKKLPDDLQAELLTRMILKGLVKKAEEEEALAVVQKRGLELLGESEKE